MKGRESFVTASRYQFCNTAAKSSRKCGSFWFNIWGQRFASGLSPENTFTEHRWKWAKLLLLLPENLVCEHKEGVETQTPTLCNK